MSGLFKIVEGELAVVRVGGVYKEVELATRHRGELFVKANGGFVRLYADGTSSLGSKLTLDTLTLDTQLYKDRLGKLCVAEAPDRKALAPNTYLSLGSDES